MSSFNRYLGRIDRNTTFALAPMLAVPFILDSLFSLQPPWPKGSTYVTAFVELAAIFVCFFVPVRSKRTLRRAQLALFSGILLLFAAYFLLYSLFVFPTLREDEFVVAGYICTEEAALYVAPLLGQTCPFLTEEALAAAQYDVERVWTPSSVRIMEFVIFLCWSFFFILATILFGITLAFVNRTERIRT